MRHTSRIVTTMSGLNKRTAKYVPFHARTQLDKLSKADLMELLWDLAMISNGSGEEDPAEDILGVIRHSHEALRYAGYQGAAKL